VSNPYLKLRNKWHSKASGGQQS